ncbi:MAG TPA: DUF6134 family protein [Yeosuana sp.]
MLLVMSYNKIFNKSEALDLKRVIKSMVFKLKYTLPFLLLSMIPLESNVPVVENISFRVVKKNTSIGFINIEKRTVNNITTFTVNSEVNANIIFNFNAVGKEKSVYKEDTLVYSSVYRMLNNKVKLNQALMFEKGKYVLKNMGKDENIGFNVINRNLVTLFFHEPIGIDKIYADKYKTMLKITPLGNRNYKVVFPNKSISIYHYQNGKCISVDVEGSFYNVQIVSSN